MMTDISGPLSDAYVDPYMDGYQYDSPYMVQDQPLLFAELDKVFRVCTMSQPETPVLPLAIILPGTFRDFGKSMDAQYLYRVTNVMHDVCRHLGITLKLTARISWECDDRTLLHLYKNTDFKHYHTEDLKNYFGKMDAQDCRTNMLGNETRLRQRAERLLGSYNLMIVGGPKVNQVMANLCHMFLIHYECLGLLRMYLVPSAGAMPLKLRRASPDGGWDAWEDRNWPHRNFGWLHMIRNPWAPKHLPRFLIYTGGFYAQGTPAAMLTLANILERFVATPDAAPSTEDGRGSKRMSKGLMTEHDSDYSAPERPARPGTRLPEDPCEFIPAHVVEAEYKVPLNWFFEAQRPGLRGASPLRFATPPAFEGSISRSIVHLGRAKRWEIDDDE